MYRFLSSGNVTSWKCAQCGQVIDAYSMTVTAALSLPIAMSGNASDFINSSAGTVSANAISGNGESDAKPSTLVARARVAVVWQNLRRVICKGGSWAKRRSNSAYWLAGPHNCGNGAPACQAVRTAQFPLIAEPSRPSA